MNTIEHLNELKRLADAEEFDESPRDHFRDEIEKAWPKILAVVDAAKDLRDSGYDGPFMGEVCAPLFDALTALES